MNLQNIRLQLFLIFLTVSITLFGCKDYNDLELESNSGDTDFSTVVAVGNSLTAGYQSDALFETAQRYSYPALVAGQMETTQKFEQPLISNPGISLGEGRLELDGSSDLTDPSNTPTPSDGSGSLKEDEVSRPFNNLGVPGALVADFLGQDLPGQPYSDRRQANPFFDIVLENEANTQSEQLGAMEPSFVMFWLGNNEVLGYVTSGGNTPYVPSDIFQNLYAGSLQAIDQTGADVVLYNIPDVTSIPYVFLINAQLVQNETIIPNPNTGFYELVTPQGNAPIWVEVTDPANPGVVQDTVRMRTPIPQQRPGGYFILSASGQLSDLFTNGVGTTPENPIPHSLVLDNGEASQAQQLVEEYNQTISGLANLNGFPVVDINGAFADIVDDGSITRDGITLTPTPGSLFSFDGVHPTNRGHGIIANMTIDVVNNTYNADLANISISEIPQGIPTGN